MISRNPLQVRDILHSEHLCCYLAENQAAKIYAKFLAEHPEFTSKDVDMYIEREEREEDHYVNGGGVDETGIIYKRREETAEEYAKRVRNEEQEVIQKYSSHQPTTLKTLRLGSESSNARRTRSGDQPK